MTNKEKNEELKKHKFIVFCSDHYNPLGIVRSLGEKGIRPIVVLNTEKVKPGLIIKSKYPSIIHEVNTPEEGLEFIIEHYGNEKSCKPFIYSSSDDICQLLDNNYDRLKESFFFFHGKCQGIVSKYLNKDNINELAIQNGAKVLKNEVLNNGEMPTSLRFPVITKALSSTLFAWKDEMHICNNESELRNAYKKIRSERILVQEFINKKNELCLDGFSINGGEEVFIPYYSSYLRFSDLSYGGYMELRKFEDSEIYKCVKEMLKKIGFTGIFEAEFLIDNDENKWFLEINFRNSTWSYAYTYGGVNMPYLWAEGELFGTIDSNFKLKSPFKAMAEWDDYFMSVQQGDLTIKQWLNDFKKSDVHYLYNDLDRKPFNVYIYIIKRVIKHLIGKE